MLDITAQTATINDPSAPMPAKIAAAAILWETIEQCEKVLETFKRDVRAVAVATGRPTVTLDGEGMSQCKVIVPGPSLRLREGTTEAGEREALGELFGTVYEVKLCLRSTSPMALSHLPPAVQAHLATVTDLVANTPRVSLKVLPGVEEVR
jgi:hypothetical protein